MGIALACLPRKTGPTIACGQTGVNDTVVHAALTVKWQLTPETPEGYGPASGMPGWSRAPARSASQEDI